MIDIVCKVDDKGIKAPNFDKILEWYHKQYRAIYGVDINLDNSTQDGQWIAIQAQAINACNQAMVTMFNSFSPSKARGASLSSNVKINGIRRMGATRSVCDVTIVGEFGTTIINGIVRDKDNKHNWLLPEKVIVPKSGSIIVAATCEVPGPIYVPAETLTKIMTPTKGWTSVSNENSSTPGKDIETDAELRIRQKQATAMPARTLLDGVISGVRGVHGVRTAQAYENDGTDFTPAGSGVPPHHIGVVVEGGDPRVIAKVIANRKGMGVGTAGTTVEKVRDDSGCMRTIKFFRPRKAEIFVAVTLEALIEYSTIITHQISGAICTYINDLLPGDKVVRTRLFCPSYQHSSEFNIIDIKLGFSFDEMQDNDLFLQFDQKAVCNPDNIKVITK